MKNEKLSNRISNSKYVMLKMWCYKKCDAKMWGWLDFSVDVATFAVFFWKTNHYRTVDDIWKLLLYSLLSLVTLLSQFYPCSVSSENNIISTLVFLMTFFLQVFIKMATLFCIFIFSLFGATCYVELNRKTSKRLIGLISSIFKNELFSVIIWGHSLLNTTQLDFFQTSIECE